MSLFKEFYIKLPEIEFPIPAKSFIEKIGEATNGDKYETHKLICWTNADVQLTEEQAGVVVISLDDYLTRANLMRIDEANAAMLALVTAINTLRS